MINLLPLEPKKIFNKKFILDLNILIESKIKKIKIENKRLNYEKNSTKKIIKELDDKLLSNLSLPYLIGTISEIIYNKKNKDKKLEGLIIKTSSRLSIFVKNSGLLNVDKLNINNLVGLNRDRYFIIQKLPLEFDHRVKTMEVEENPNQTYQDIGGLDNQIQELIESVVLPITNPQSFIRLGISPPKGVLLHGPPGMGKTLLARACASQTKATFLKLAGPLLVQMYIGEGASLVREAFELAKKKKPTIMFIDEIDAIGTKRFDSEINGDREVQRTMLELLNQLDGFSTSNDIKVIAATNRIDILDPALLRSGRFDRKIEFPFPDKTARSKILEIHSRKLNLSPKINFDEISEVSIGLNGAQLRAICVEAGMIAIRRWRKTVIQKDLLIALSQIQKKKKNSLPYCL